MNIGIVLPFETRSDLISAKYLFGKNDREQHQSYSGSELTTLHLAVKSLPNKQTRYKMDPAFR
jgi:hypothetical protein